MSTDDGQTNSHRGLHTEVGRGEGAESNGIRDGDGSRVDNGDAGASDNDIIKTITSDGHSGVLDEEAPEEVHSVAIEGIVAGGIRKRDVMVDPVAFTKGGKWRVKFTRETLARITFAIEEGYSLERIARRYGTTRYHIQKVEQGTYVSHTVSAEQNNL